MVVNNNKEKTIAQKAYPTNEIKFFSSFEEENEYTAMRRAGLSYDERMEQIEMLRKWVFRKFLLADKTWPPISKTFKIMPPYANEISQ